MHRLQTFIEQLPVSADYPCSYLPAQLARQQQMYWPPEAGPLPPQVYQSLMDQHFRRSGRLLYRPRCQACTQCVPIRMDVQLFEASRSQRRVLRRNRQVLTHWQRPQLTDEKLELYRRYQAQWHRKQTLVSHAELSDFLYDSPTDTWETEYRLDGRLLAVGISDRTPSALSTVYFYHDPAEQARALGVLSALHEIAQADAWGLRYYYLGYWIADCSTMHYKATLSDHELLVRADDSPPVSDLSPWRRHPRQSLRVF